MKNYIAFLLAFVTIDLTQLTIGQDLNNNIQSIYGLNPYLYNGKLYSFIVPSNVIGNQYFKSTAFQLGSVRIKGIEYNSLLLNYDIFNQKVVIKYSNISGFKNIIEISDAWLEEFKIQDCNFKILQDEKKTSQIYQYFGIDSLAVYIKWKKKLVLENETGLANYVFQEPEKELFLFSNYCLIQFKNNRSFLRLFKPAKQLLIKKYLNGHNINLKKTNDSEIIGLVEFCNRI